MRPGGPAHCQGQLDNLEMVLKEVAVGSATDCWTIA